MMVRNEIHNLEDFNDLIMFSAFCNYAGSGANLKFICLFNCMSMRYAAIYTFTISLSFTEPCNQYYSCKAVEDNTLITQ